MSYFIESYNQIPNYKLQQQQTTNSKEKNERKKRQYG